MSRNTPFHKQKPDNKPQLAVTMDDVGADKTEVIQEVNNEVNKEVKDDNKTEVEVNVENKVEDAFDEFLTSVIEPKPPEKVQVTVYLEPAVAKAFDKYSKKHGKGAKSMLVNKFLKQILKVTE